MVNVNKRCAGADPDLDLEVLDLLLKDLLLLTS